MFLLDPRCGVCLFGVVGRAASMGFAIRKHRARTTTQLQTSMCGSIVPTRDRSTSIYISLMVQIKCLTCPPHFPPLPTPTHSSPCARAHSPPHSMHTPTNTVQRRGCARTPARVAKKWLDLICVFAVVALDLVASVTHRLDGWGATPWLTPFTVLCQTCR